MILFASTILLSAFLLFLVQPIIAKQILPWFGGTSAVWITCLVFFQVLLLAGYTYAHVITRRFSLRRQSRLHIALLLASLLFLPIIPSAALKPTADADAALRILVLLAATIGLPYFLLSTTGPLLQKWVAPHFPEKSVYRLFALSNFGSLIGLLAFPFAVEPFATSTTQSMVWSAAYALFVGVCSWSAWRVGRREGATHRDDGCRPCHRTASAAAAPRARRLPAVARVLGARLGDAAGIDQSHHAEHRLGAVPLGAAAVAVPADLRHRVRRARRTRLVRTELVAVHHAAADRRRWRPACRPRAASWTSALPFRSTRSACSWRCSSATANSRTASRRRSYLTHFYLMVSLGGALGGLFVGLVAPRIFPAYLELPLALVLLAGLAVVVAWRNKWLVGPAIVASLATLWYAGEYLQFMRDDVVFMQRNFYGTLRVREQGSGDYQVRRLLHGVILHGEQFTISPDRLEPGTYYARTSGVGRAIAAKQAAGPVRIGVVGLGVGTLSAYGRAGDVVRFYELDPDVLALAKSHFGYLNAAPAQLEFVIGDARLSMERELAAGTPQKFDVLAIDAFSSDSIPVHLITREAIRLYMQQLAPGGVLAIHISNRFLDLKPVLANIARGRRPAGAAGQRPPRRTGFDDRLGADLRPRQSHSRPKHWRWPSRSSRHPASRSGPISSTTCSTC